jgi:hypothetical protein
VGIKEERECIKCRRIEKKWDCLWPVRVINGVANRIFQINCQINCYYYYIYTFILRAYIIY